jgi:DNA-directed RNA polymerase specialized sigma24 family protein
VPQNPDSASLGANSAAPRDEGSVTQWIDGLKLGDPHAAQALWERYFGRLVRLARARLAPCAGADEDEEDAALSAFDSFCAGLARGRFPLLADREDLWRLLVVITARKAAAQVDRRRAWKRGGLWLRADRGAPALDSNDRDGDRLAEIIGREPTPEFAAMMAEQFRRLLDRLGDDQLRQIALERMEGYTADEIAERLGCARRTVARRLELIRQLWAEEEPV